MTFHQDHWRLERLSQFLTERSHSVPLVFLGFWVPTLEPNSCIRAEQSISTFNITFYVT